MGTCVASHKINEYTDTEIEKKLNVDEKRENTIKKILLLGTPSSGKSTIFRQLQWIHGWGDEEEEVLKYAHIIREDIMSQILVLLRKSQQLYESDLIRFKQCLINIEDENIYRAIQYVVCAAAQFSLNEKTANGLVLGYIGNFENQMNTFIPEEIVSLIFAFYYILFETQNDEMQRLGTSIGILWDLDAIQHTFTARGNYYSFPDNMDYYFNNVECIFSLDFFPTIEDRMKYKYPGTGLLEATYEINDQLIHIIDYNHHNIGKMSDKIGMMLENTSALIYVAALNHFNTFSLRDKNKNAMQESIELFEELVNSKWFRKTEIILFLNKCDLFRKSLVDGHTLRECFHVEHGWHGDQWDINNKQDDMIDYESQNDVEKDNELFEQCYESALTFISNQYFQRNQNVDKRIFSHVTTSTDKDNIEMVFWDIQNIIIHTTLKRGS